MGIHADRRQRLLHRLQHPVLLLGSGEQVRNLPMNKLPFRQDSTFLYFTGCDRPDAAALFHPGGYDLFLPEPDADDALWHGTTPSREALAERYGADRVVPLDQLERHVRDAQPMTLAVADERRNQSVAAWLGQSLRFGEHHGHDALVDAVIAMRRVKSEDEIEAMKRAARATEKAFDAVIRATHVGSHERSLAALFHGVLAVQGFTTGYSTILSQSGDVLHNHRHDAPLSSGRMVLLDGGGEGPEGYGVDITRTWPVSGTFTPRQRAAYDAVLAAQSAAIHACQVGARYREVHDAACRVLATWLRDEGLLKVGVDEALERQAHAVFYPHGTGHHLGLDVHDLENFGDRPSYPAGRGRSPLFGLSYLRLDLPLEPGWVVTVEPGFYVVPAILADRSLRDRLADAVDFEAAAEWVGFGGIRIEDDVVVRASGPEVLTRVVKDPDLLLAQVGAGPSAEERLS